VKLHNPDEVQQEIIEEFGLFGDWMDRYQYLIDLGKKLTPLDEAERRDQNLLQGCQSRVWLVMDGDKAAMKIRANSDSAIVSGLIALLIRVYSGASPSQVLASAPRFVEDIGLSSHLSPTRSNGLHAMLAAVRGKASELQNA
jgi:cysteine desulfuration protein SufE